MGWRRAVSLLAVLLFVGGAAAVGVLWHEGYRVYAVRSGSMSPTLPIGSLVVAGPVSSPIAPGDVVTFRSGDGDPALTTHRVVAVSGQELVTKGDANSSVDPSPVSRDAVVARQITSVAGAGFAAVYLQQPAGVASAMTLVLWLLLLRQAFFPTAEPLARVGRHAQHRHATA